MNSLLSTLLALQAFARRGFRKLTPREQTEAQLLRLQWFPCLIDGGTYLAKPGFYGPGTFALVGTPGENFDPSQPVRVKSISDHLVPWRMIDSADLALFAEAVCNHEETSK